MVSDTEFILLLKSKDLDAFSLLYDKYAQAVYLLVYTKLHQKENTGNILQKVYCTAWRQVNDLDRNKPDVYHWLAGIAYKTVNELQTQVAENSAGKNIHLQDGRYPEIVASAS